MKTYKSGDFEIEYDEDDQEVSVLVDIDAVIEGSLGKESDLEDKVSELMDELEDDGYMPSEIASFIIENAEALGLPEMFELVHDNSYNWSSEFSQDIDFVVIGDEEAQSDWIYSGNSFIIVSKHHGGDPRGNYERAVIYNWNEEGSYGDNLLYLLDGHVGWWLSEKGNSDNTLDEYETGYQSEPTYHLNQDAESIIPIFKNRKLEHFEIVIKGITYIGFPYHGAVM